MPPSPNRVDHEANIRSSHQHERRREEWFPALWVAGIYALVSIVWILLSDRVAAALAPDPAALSQIQNVKGSAFVLASSLLILLLVHRLSRRLERSRRLLAAGERHFRLLYEDSPTAYQSLDEQGRLLQVNTAWLTLLDRRREDVLGRSFTDFVRPDASEHLAAEFAQFLATGGMRDLELEIVRRDGTVLVVSINGRVLLDDEGRFEGAHWVLHDITARIQAECALRDSEHRLRLALEGASMGTFEWYQDTGRLTCDERQAELFGIGPGDLEGDVAALERRIHPDDLAPVKRAVDVALHADLPFTVEFRVLMPDGVMRWRSVSGRRLHLQGDRPETICGVSRDINARKRAVWDRDTLFENSADLLCVTDMAGNLLQVNPAWTKVLGWTAEELTGRPYLDFVHPDDRRTTAGVAQALTEGREAVGFSNRYRSRDGSYRRLSWKSVPFQADRVVVAVARDVTEQHLMEEQLRQAQKMEAVGQLAGGVAHDFNNLLQVISGFAEMALISLNADHPARANIEQVISAGERAAGLVGQLLAFSRRQVLRPEDLDLNEVVRSALRMIERTLGEHIRIEFAAGDDLGTVHADRGQLEQVLMNLCINARDAMPGGGVLELATEDVCINAAFCDQHAWAREGRFVKLVVSDSGVGMGPVTLDRVWEPFFTTKEPGKGTGLGLATVYGIVRQHDGLVHTESAPGTGTTFEIFVPAIERAATSTPARVDAPARGGTETIMVAEDDAAVRGLVKAVLEQAGYDVLTAVDGEEALRILTARGEAVDLALLDVVMPGLGGREVHDRVRESMPHLRCIFASGYDLDGVHTDFVLDEGLDLIRKPFDRRVLLERVREVLDRA